MAEAHGAQPIVTLSFDDGHHDDLKVAERLAKWNLKATFYVAFNEPGSLQITTGEIRELFGAGHEIGSHTLSHKVLITLPPEAVEPELEESKARLEDIIGAPVGALSYPLGYRNARIVDVARRAGYSVGRTQDRFRTGRSFDPMQMPVSTEFYPHARSLLARHLVRDADLTGLSGWIRTGLSRDPLIMAKCLFAAATASSGIFHLTARSWEITALDRWHDFENVLGMVGRQRGIEYLTNSGVAAAVSGEALASAPA